MNKLEYKVISDSTYDKQEGVRSCYFDKNAWIKTVIEDMGSAGWELYQRLKGECMIFKRERDK